MFGRNRRLLWTLPIVMQAALLSAGPVSGAEEQPQAGPGAQVEPDGPEDVGKDSKKENVRTIIKARIPNPDGGEKQKEDSPKKDVNVGQQRRIEVISPDGKVFRIVTPEGSTIYRERPSDSDSAEGVAPNIRGLTVFGKDNGEVKTFEPHEIQALLGELTGRMKDGTAVEAPRFLIGVSVSEAPEVVLVQLGKPDMHAVVVEAVIDESPAEKAGVQKHDLIIKANGEPMKSPGDLTAVVKAAEGKEVELVLIRKGKEQTVRVTPRPNDKETPTMSIRGMIHIGPGLIERRTTLPDDSSGLMGEIKALRSEVGELKKMLEEMKRAK